MLDLIKLANKKRFKWLSDEEVEYLEKNFPWTATNQEAVWCLKNEIKDKPVCKYNGCYKDAIFKPREGYSGCSKSHNTKLTNLEKYGVENVKQHKEFIKKAKSTWSSKSDNDKKIIQEKKIATNIKKYGVTNPSYSQEIKDKISNKNKANAASRMIKLKENNQEKYGVDNVFQLDSVKQKSKNTLTQKYGVENPSQSNEIKLKKEATCMKNFGVRNPQQDDEIFDKTNRYRWKDYKLPSGKIVKVQGYENMALDILLKKYDEKDLVLQRKDIPKVYYGENNKHQYTTDIFIPKENKFIEVKSPYTFKKYLEINLLKEQASIDGGFNFEFMILDSNGIIVEKNNLI